MTRGLPYSIGIHLLVFVFVLFYGNTVQRQEIRTPRSIRVKMVELPEVVRTQTETPAEQVVEEPAQVVKEESPPDLPVKEVPEAKPQPEEKPEEKPRPKDEVVQDKPPLENTPETDPEPTSEAAVPEVAGPSIQGTDADFPFAWYLARVQGQIARNWNPKQLGFRSRSMVSCVVHFTINKNGRVSQVTLTSPSGVGVFDREALRVVQSSRIPPLPPTFASTTLGVSMKFNLESGI